MRFPVTWDSSLTHKVEVATVADFAASRLGVDPSGGLSALDWLSVTGQSVLEVTAGRCSPTGPAPWRQSGRCWTGIRRTSSATSWPPTGGIRICQLLPMMGRAAEAGDELGSRLLSA